MPVDGFKWKTVMSTFDKKFMENYDENSNKGYTLEVDIEYPKNLHDLHIDLTFLPERMKINKCNKLVCTIFDKKRCCPHKELKTSIKA